ncbi:hypothetical protein D3C87_217970 [compost metagenome]
MDFKIAAEKIILLKNNDLEIREKLIQDGELGNGYHPEMEKVHRENAQYLKQIIEQIGFPTISKVGEKASDAAWLIIQHSISDPELMKSAYQMMLENMTDINLKNLAYLSDRIQFFQGKPQKFGTQYNSDGSIYPVMDKKELGELRKKYNLSELSQEEIDKIPSIEQIETIENQNPDYILWRQKVGWK